MKKLLYRQKEEVRARLSSGRLTPIEAAELFEYLLLQALGEIARQADDPAVPLAELIAGAPLFEFRYPQNLLIDRKQANG